MSRIKLDYMNVFPTIVWFGKSQIDNRRLRDKIDKFISENEETDMLSNMGGYQKNGIEDEELVEFIKNSIPETEDKEFDKIFGAYSDPFDIFMWSNKNGKGHWNMRHQHFHQTIPTFLSGVYYVSVPENSGVIRFFDPRGSMTAESLDQEYYFNSAPYQYLQPEDGMLVLFPSWLEHDVTPNQNDEDEDRYSIAFNIMMSPPDQRKQSGSESDMWSD